MRVQHSRCQTHRGRSYLAPRRSSGGPPERVDPGPNSERVATRTAISSQLFSLTDRRSFPQYMAMSYIASPMLQRELKKGSAELLILSLIEVRPRHGYDISKLIERRSEGTLRFHVASLYPLLYRWEKRGWISGRWVEKAGQRRRRYYRLTAEGQEVLASQKRGWQAFVRAIQRITRAEHA
jgi:PadR family transcriptional regulator PadR